MTPERLAIIKAKPHGPDVAELIAEVGRLRLAGDRRESIGHPLHYGGDTAYEAIKVIEAWDLDFHLGNTVKYIARAGKNGAALEDLKKAAWYLQRKIERCARDAGGE